jgi:WD40 repeat protein
MKHFLFVFVFVFIFALSIPLFASDFWMENSGGHRGSITGIVHDRNTVLSVGEDGFLVRWDINQRKAIDRFQLTTYRIHFMASHPSRNEFCILETSGTGNYRISVWDHSRRQKLFTISDIEGPVTFINYSANGSFIIIGDRNGRRLYIIDSRNGQIISEPSIPSGINNFAVSGRAERNILVYQSEYYDNEGRSSFSGQILYFDLQSNTVTGSFQAPGFLTNIVIFGNNRFLAGISHDGLQIIDAATGALLDSRRNIGRAALLHSFNDGFYCLVSGSGNTILYRFTTDRNGRLLGNQQTLPFDVSQQISAFFFNSFHIFGSNDGNIFQMTGQNRIIPFSYNTQIRITEIAAGNTTIAFLGEDNILRFFAYTAELQNRNEMPAAAVHRNYNRLTHVSINELDHFILWQNNNTTDVPRLFNADGEVLNNIGFLIGRQPLRSISIFNNKMLILDSGGNITVRSIESLLASSSPRADFAFSAVGATDAAFISHDYILVSRSGINPFFFLNIATTETVPVPFAAKTGILTYAAPSGRNYAAAVIHHESGLKTSILELNVSLNPSIIFEYHGEALYVSIAESRDNLAIVCGNKGAQLILSDEIREFERTPGLPIKIQARGNYFICLDSEGNISLHNITGRIETTFFLPAN